MLSVACLTVANYCPSAYTDLSFPCELFAEAVPLNEDTVLRWLRDITLCVRTFVVSPLPSATV